MVSFMSLNGWLAERVCLLYLSYYWKEEYGVALISMGMLLSGSLLFFLFFFSLIWFIYRTSLLVLCSNLKSELFNLKKPAKQDRYHCYSTTLNNNAVKS